MPRPEATQNLRARLLTDGAIPGVLKIIAIYGMGGIGKSTIAAALASDPKVPEHFPDGVLWALLGQQPDLPHLLSGWVQALGDFKSKPLSVDAATAHLRMLLREKAALLVVDDAWDPAHVRPFLVGGLRCRILITTRRLAVADEVGADLFPLDVLSPEQSLSLLAAHLGRDLVPAERVEAPRLAEAVGFLPLALELAAARVKRGVSWTKLRRTLEAEVVRVEELEDPRRRRTGQARLKTSFNNSLGALRSEDRAAYEAFVGLGLLPEDAAIAAPMAATLWDVEEAEAAVLLDLLRGESLLLPGIQVRVGERTMPSYRLYDLLHDHARRLLTAAPDPDRPDDLPGLGLTLSAAHARLLERYRARTQGNLWHTLPDDGYIHAHLSWHWSRPVGRTSSTACSARRPPRAATAGSMSANGSVRWRATWQTWPAPGGGRSAGRRPAPRPRTPVPVRADRRVAEQPGREPPAHIAGGAGGEGRVAAVAGAGLRVPGAGSRAARPSTGRAGTASDGAVARRGAGGGAGASGTRGGGPMRWRRWRRT